MTQAKKKETENEELDESVEETGMKNVNQDFNLKQKLRRISPLGMRVVVAIRDLDNTTDGGLYLPETAKSNQSESLLAEVLEVASAIDEDTDEEANISGVPLGSTVLIEKDAGIKVPWNESLRIVDTQDILATVDEIDIT